LRHHHKWLQITPRRCKLERKNELKEEEEEVETCLAAVSVEVYHLFFFFFLRKLETTFITPFSPSPSLPQMLMNFLVILSLFAMASGEEGGLDAQIDAALSRDNPAAEDAPKVCVCALKTGRD
jgi:hypothetical protein